MTEPVQPVPPTAEAGMTPLKRALVVIEKLQKRVEELERAAHEPIAVIGLACRFPGGASDPAAYWEVLQAGVDAITEIPADRWSLDEFYDPQPGVPGKIYSRWGGFLDRVDLFDAALFKISPREASRMDPQQRILLEVAWETLESAAQDRDRLAGSRTGVFVGISSNDYSVIQQGDVTRVDAYSGTGNAFSIAANRLSYAFDFQGPSVAVDTACSSSLVALHLACQSLRRRESDMALAGGVNVILAPELTIAFSHAHMMSADGRCKTFDASADGYVRGEGCGMVALKRLSDAQRDGDPILAVIYGTAINQDGRSNGLTAPNGLAQQRVIRDALADANLTPDQIDYVETHGTGTILGDPIEVQALGAVMRDRPQDRPLAIGSVKTNIGHLEAAAGAASLIKVILSLQHEQIPPHLHLKQVNPHIPLDELPLTIPTVLRPWPRGERPRYAGISSFGFGGTNAHVIVGEAPAPAQTKNPVDRPRHLAALAAKSSEALAELAGRHAAFLAQNPDLALADVAHTLNSGRTHFRQGVRLAAHAETTAQLAAQLAAFAAGREAPGLLSGQPRPAGSARIAFLFTGQGAQCAGMGRRLYATQPTFRQALDRCAAIFDAEAALHGDQRRGLLDVIFGQPGAEGLIDETLYTQPALFALEYALAQLWMSWGVQPRAVMGHSVGEYVAATVAGVFSLEDGMRLIAERGRLMQSLPHNGDMAVIFAEPARVTAVLNGSSQVSIAAVNGPTNVVISGLHEEVQAVAAKLQGEGVTTRLLTVSHAFHSPLMEPILERFEQRAREVNYRPPQLAIVSNLSGKLVAAGDPLTYDASYWRRHVREAVQFDAGMLALAEAGCDVFIEIGPHPTLINMGKRCLGNAGAGGQAGDRNVPSPAHGRLWLASLHKESDDWQPLLDSLASLYTAGVPVDWAGFDKDYARARLTLPTYAFQRERYWFAEPTAGAGGLEAPARRSGRTAAKPAAEPPTAPALPPLSRETLWAAEPEERKALLETQIRSHLARVLSLPADRITADQHLNNLGLDSIMAIELKNAVETALQVELPIATLLQGPTIGELADDLLARLAAPEAAAGPRLRPATVDEEPPLDAQGRREYALSPNQQAMWLQHQMAPSSVYNPVYAVRIRSTLDVDAWRRALQVLVARHAALRTTFHAADGTPRQLVHEHMEAGFYTVDAAGWSDGELQRRLNEEAHRVFDLENGPLLRMFLFSRSADDHVLLISAHHIVVDMWSLATLISELHTLLTAGGGPEAVQLPPMRLAYTDYVRWQHEMLAGPAGERLWDYWRTVLAGELPDLNLPTDRPRPTVQTFHGAIETLPFGHDLTQRIRAFSEQRGVTPFVTLLAAWQTLMHRYTGQEDVIVGSPMTGRTQPDLAQLVGYFVNPVALRASFVGSPTFAQLVAQVNQAVLGALDHQDYPFPLLVEKLAPARNPSRTPIFQVMFALQRPHLMYEQGLSGLALGLSGLPMRLGDVEMETVAITKQVSPFDLTMQVADTEEELAASLTYNTDLFDEPTVRRMLGHYAALLEDAIGVPDQSVGTLTYLSKAEQDQLLRQWSHREEREPATSALGGAPLRETIQEMFEAQAALRPDAVALVYNGVQVSYRELDERANRLANFLRSQGVGPEVMVVLCLERSVEMIVGVLGVLKAGGAYVPLDPSIPVNRLRGILRDVQAPIVLTQQRLCDDLRSHFEDGLVAPPSVIRLDSEWPSIEQYPATQPPQTVDGRNLAYVIYTSGSTGNPKGVLLAHAGLCNLVAEQTRLFGIRPDDRVLQFASFTFDASVSEVFMALTTGAALVLVDREHVLSPVNLARALRGHGITVVTLPPTLLRQMTPDELPDLRVIISAGEACTLDLVERWVLSGESADGSWIQSGRQFFNAYGPTETTIGPTCFLANSLAGQSHTKARSGAAPVPIGQPIGNMDVYILDSRMQPVAVGVPGELFIGGVGVARGYLHQPELSAQKFVPNPFVVADASCASVSSRLYRTGDLARWLPDGSIEFMGRIDHQVKIRGFRVEPGEIESVLAQHPRVEEAVVLAVDFEAGDKRLVAYVALRDQLGAGSTPSGSEAEVEDALRAHLKQRLPDYMIPANFVLMATMPRLPSGKVDRKALPSPASVRTQGNGAAAAPQTDLERTLLEIWERTLNAGRIGIHDNFFDLGGHSLLLAKVHTALEQALERQISIVDLIKYPTIHSLAGYLAGASDGSKPSQPSVSRAQQQKQALAGQRARAQAVAGQRGVRRP